ncbi:MAG: hypothetical protein JEY94_18085 [Melioribacteraceae bacterium]|nr:hypothetical protein [Melioribacteraceae bacterium]
MRSRIVSILLLFFSILLFQFCEEDNPSSPDKEETPEKTSISVGVEGGVIDDGNIVITVPNGTFSSATEISVSVPTEENPFSNGEITAFRKIEGIPNDYNKPIEVKLKLNKTDNNYKYIAIGAEGFAKSLGKSQISYKLVEAEEKDGFLICTISSVSQNQLRKATKPDDGSRAYYLAGLGGKTPNISSNGHFKIMSTDITIGSSEINSIGSILENTYTRYEQMGYLYANRTSWPIDVCFRYLDPKLDGYHQSSMFGYNSDYLVFNNLLLRNPGKLKITAGHEFHHFIQGLYDNRNSYARAKEAGINYWINEATAVWSEELFSDNTAYSPAILSGNEQESLSGLHKDTDMDVTGNVEQHGYGMAPFIKYLVENYGQERIIPQLFMNTYSGKHPVVVLQGITGDLTACYTNFIDEYALGNIYDIPFSKISSGIDKTWKIDGPEDTVMVYDNSYYDLSSRIFKVQFSYPEIDITSKVKFSVSGGNNKIAVFKYKRITSQNEIIEKIGTGEDSFSISDINSYVKDNFNIVAIVTNSRLAAPYTNQNNLSLEIKLENPPKLTEHNLDYIIIGHIKLEEPDNVTYYDSKLNSNPDYTISGDYNENVFTGNWNINDYDGYETSGNITAKFNDDKTEIIEYSFNEISKNSNTNRTTVSATMTNIPLSSASEDQNIYEVIGSSTSSHISGFNLVIINDEQKLTLMNYKSDNESKIRLIFKKKKLSKENIKSKGMISVNF